ncbi:MAG: Rieske 2Fe-2S domain-containing protein, partial [Beijerinckiaceae bacterium]
PNLRDGTNAALFSRTQMDYFGCRSQVTSDDTLHKPLRPVADADIIEETGMDASNPVPLTEPLDWPHPGHTSVPFRLYSDQEIYELELERVFRGPVWNYICIEAEIPNAGDYKASWIAETPVIAVRDKDGSVNVLVNRCAHKGALVCPKERGNAPELTCLYHAWTYDLKGQLTGVAFRNGVKGKGGMPKDFDVKQHRLERLRVETFAGLVFATFSDKTPDVATYLGPDMAKFMRRNFDRPLKILGVQSQIIHNNWKLYAENIRDSYHATLLHTFYTTFKVNRLDTDGGIVLGENKWHHISYSKGATLKEADEYKNDKVHAARYNSKLEGPQLLERWDEFDDGITHSIQSFFPNLCLQLTFNSLAIRFFVPRGVDKTELLWFYLGVEGDTEEQTQLRVRQGNLTGSAGLVSLEDGCINEFVQRGIAGSEDANSFIQMGGRDVESSEDSRATEVAIRGFWDGYRRLMGF